MGETPPLPFRRRALEKLRFPSGGWLLMAMLLLVVLVVPGYLETSARDNLNPSAVIHMISAIRGYAADHEDHLPPTLAALVTDSSTQEYMSKCRYHDPKTGERLDWLYYPREKWDDGIPEGTILLAAPTPAYDLLGRKTRRIWGRELRKIIPEGDFQRLIREQNLPPPAR